MTAVNSGSPKAGRANGMGTIAGVVEAGRDDMAAVVVILPCRGHAAGDVRSKASSTGTKASSAGARSYCRTSATVSQSCCCCAEMTASTCAVSTLTRAPTVPPFARQRLQIDVEGASGRRHDPHEHADTAREIDQRGVGPADVEAAELLGHVARRAGQRRQRPGGLVEAPVDEVQGCRRSDLDDREARPGDGPSTGPSRKAGSSSPSKRTSVTIRSRPSRVRSTSSSRSPHVGGGAAGQ